MKTPWLALLFVAGACASSGDPGKGADAGLDASDAGPQPDGGIECTETCAVHFEYPLEAGLSSVEVFGDVTAEPWAQGIALTRTPQGWQGEVELSDRQYVEYKFVLNGESWVLDPNNDSRMPDGTGNDNSAMSVDCGCSQGKFDWRDAIMYFAFVDRFADGNSGNNQSVADVDSRANYQGGDFAGLRSKVEEGYFDELGVNVIWITSPFDNANGAWLGKDGRNYSAYHGYWPRDMEAVESRFGSLADLNALVDAAHARNIKVVIDYVMNHVHSESPLYSDHPDWFWPNDNGLGGDCICGGGCGWDGDQGRRCWFENYLPDFNFTHPDALDWSVDHAVRWITETGVDGYRLDAVKHIETEWLYELRRRLREGVEAQSKETFYLVGETYTGDQGLIGSYVDPLTKLDGQFDFPLRAEISRVILRRAGSMNELSLFISNNDTVYHNRAVMSTFVGNHDLPRIVHVAEDEPLFGDWDDGKWLAWDGAPGQPQFRAPYERLGVAFALIMTSPGVPLIYYGDEIGLAGAGDPDNRRFMQWDGYTADQVWLREHLSKLTEVRASQPALRRGKRNVLGATADTLTYEMVLGDQRVIVALNRGDSPHTPAGVPPGTYTDLMSGEQPILPLALPARSVSILVSE
jgi:glycosidase